MKKKIYEYVEVVVTALILALIIRTFVIQAFKIPSESMVPTLKIRDHLFVCKFIYGLPIPLTDKHILKWHDPQRGDVIVFRYPKDPSIDFIKRIIGLPGDKIIIKNKQVYINGKPLIEPYKVHSNPMPFSSMFNSTQDNWDTPRIIPPDSYFVMGDNRDNSRDSRFWGVLKRDYIKGKALFIYWPPFRIGLIQ
ncbi:MAG: signal peptidase I [bacterium]